MRPHTRASPLTAGAAARAGVILLTCVNALAYNVVHYLMIKHTSSVTTTVLGEMKIIVILLLSAVVLGEGPCVSGMRQHLLPAAATSCVRLPLTPCLAATAGPA